MFCGPLSLYQEATMFRKKLRNVNPRMPLSFGNDPKPPALYACSVVVWKKRARITLSLMLVNCW